MPRTQVTDALAATKFAPPRVPPGWVARPRLDAALERGLQAPLTLIAASPGAGKSALLGSWVAARRCEGTLAWLSLEGLDRDRRRFWRGVLEALSRAGAPEPVASLTVHPTESVDLVVPELVNALEHVDQPIVLVLDDLHEVGDGAAIADLDRLLRHPPAALRIVAATRIDPPLRLGRMRLAGDLSDIRERDLAFTEAETGALLRAGGTELEPAAVRVLWQRTEGWAAGLRMAAIALRTHPDPGRFVAAFAGDDVAMADYLLSEVLAQQPPELVDFLLRTSIVSLVSGELATVLTGRADADRLLARLEREHALVAAIGDDRLWHRYHPLLRELLRSELRFRRAGEVPELHARAARWYAARERPAEALRHAADAGEWEMVARLAGEHWMPLLVSGELGHAPPRARGAPARARARGPRGRARARGDDPRRRRRARCRGALPPRRTACGRRARGARRPVRARARRRRRDPGADAGRPRRRRAPRRAAARHRRGPRPAHARAAQPRDHAALDRARWRPPPATSSPPAARPRPAAATGSRSSPSPASPPTRS